MHGGFSSAVVVDSRHLNIPYIEYTCTSSCENTYGFTLFNLIMPVRNS